MQTNLLFIDGESCAADKGAVADLVSPVDRSTYGTCAMGAEQDAWRAVAAARRELHGGAWGSIDGEGRARLMFRLADLMERDFDQFVEMDSFAIGRSPAEARALDVPNAIGTMRYAAGWADKLEGRSIPNAGHMGTPMLSYTRLEPLGVVVAIVPWNAPLMITTWKLAALLAAGCTAVIKPSEETPQSALHLARLAQEAGFPDGVINVVPGRGATLGPILCSHPDVAMISFTGSTRTGAEIARTAAPLFKRLSLELGGKSPQIIFADASFDAAVDGCAMGIFTNQGQICVAGSRILVHRSLAGRFGDALAAKARAIKVGDPRQEGVTMGAVANASQFAQIDALIRSGIEDGATLLAGGAPEPSAGWFVRPTVFADASSDMRIAQEEIFGPVATIIEFDDEEEAISLANDTAFGLAATIWTRDISRSHRVAARIHAGTVSVNGWGPVDTRLSTGGVKASGMGRECGHKGILEFTEEKLVNIVLA
jgi:acyl-CoA reductase-like NAD-dependent aldehyde dehydrogenase